MKRDPFCVWGEGKTVIFKDGSVFSFSGWLMEEGKENSLSLSLSLSFCLLLFSKHDLREFV
jgi:uncharacterized membrane protein (UPF0136 family)